MDNLVQTTRGGYFGGVDMKFVFSILNKIYCCLFLNNDMKCILLNINMLLIANFRFEIFMFYFTLLVCGYICT